MEKEMDDLTSLWKGGTQGSSQKESVGAIIAQAQQRKRSSLMSHYGNIAIMTGVMILVSVFFLYLYPFRTMLSIAGVYTMIAGLAIRIVIEIFSVMRSGRIQLSDAVATKTDEALQFYNFRRTIHGPVTIVCVGLYVVGWFMLTPEYARHIPMWLLVTMDAGFVVMAVVLIVVIRRGLMKEIADLYKIVELRRQLENGK
jgi:hypothetical protein